MKLTIEIADKDIAGLICSGLEGGISYWAKLFEVIYPSGELPPEVRMFGMGSFPLFGGALHFDVHEEGGKKTGDPELDAKAFHRLDTKSIQKGLELMAKDHPYHFGTFISDGGDATTGDVFIQLCLFGRIIFA